MLPRKFMHHPRLGPCASMPSSARTTGETPIEGSKAHLRDGTPVRSPASLCVILSLVRASRWLAQRGLLARHPSKDPQCICRTAHEMPSSGHLEQSPRSLPSQSEILCCHGSYWPASARQNRFFEVPISKDCRPDTHQRIHSAFAGQHPGISPLSQVPLKGCPEAPWTGPPPSQPEARQMRL